MNLCCLEEALYFLRLNGLRELIFGASCLNCFQTVFIVLTTHFCRGLPERLGPQSRGSAESRWSVTRRRGSSLSERMMCPSRRFRPFFVGDAERFDFLPNIFSNMFSTSFSVCFLRS
jgi:hypothetical protein